MTKRYQIIIYIIVSLSMIILFSGFFNIFISVNERDKLLLEINSLEVEKRNLLNIIDSNEELSILHDFNYNIIYGNVTLRSIYTFNDFIKIDIGSNDGVSVGDSVISYKGFLGIVDSVSKNTSIIKLLSNDKFNLSVKVNDNYGNYNDYSITNLIGDNSISVNDLVYTSGLTDIVGDIYVGRVESVINNNLDTELKVDLVDINNINYVGVIK